MDEILPLCKTFESKVVQYIYRFRPGLTPSSSRAPSRSASMASLSGPRLARSLTAPSATSSGESSSEKERSASEEPSMKGWGSTVSTLDLEKTVEEDEGMKKARPVVLYAPLYSGLATAADICE
jgi:hypothetical protein